MFYIRKTYKNDIIKIAHFKKFFKFVNEGQLI